MSVSIYSKTLYENSALPASSTILSFPESGFVTYVVRNIEVFNSTPSLIGLNGFEVLTPDSTVIFGVMLGLARTGKVYPWRGRVVLTEPELLWSSSDLNWQIQVSGYAFTS